MISVAISPDGRQLVYMSHSKLFTRSLDQPTARELAWHGKRKISLLLTGWAVGGLLRERRSEEGFHWQADQRPFLAKCPLGNGGSWGEDGSIVAGCNFTLSKVPASGGRRAPLTELRAGRNRPSLAAGAAGR